MYCQECGKQIPDGSGFCQFCGTKQVHQEHTLKENIRQNQLKTDDISYAETMDAVGAAVKNEYKKASKPKRFFSIVALIIIVFVAIKVIGAIIGWMDGNLYNRKLSDNIISNASVQVSQASDSADGYVPQAEVAADYTDLTSSEIDSEVFNNIWSNNIKLGNKTWKEGRWITDDDNGFLSINYNQDRQLYTLNFVYSDYDQFYIGEYPIALANFPNDFSGDDIGELKLTMLTLDESKDVLIVHVQPLVQTNVDIPKYLVLTPDKNYIT